MEGTEENGSASKSNDGENSTLNSENYEPVEKSSKIEHEEAGSPVASTSGTQKTAKKPNSPKKDEKMKYDVMIGDEYSTIVVNDKFANGEQSTSNRSADPPIRKRKFINRNYRPRIDSSSSSDDDDDDDYGGGNPESMVAEDIINTHNADGNDANRAAELNDGIDSPVIYSSSPLASSSDDTMSFHEDMVIDSDNDSDSDSGSNASTISEETTIRINAVMDKKPPKNDMCLIKSLLYRQHGLTATTATPSMRNDLTSIPFRNRIMGSLYAVERLEMAHNLKGHGGCVNCINFNETGDLLVSGGDDLHLCIWKWASNKMVLKCNTGHRQNIFQTKFIENGINANGFNIVSSSRDGDVRYIEIGPDGTASSSRVLYSHSRRPVNKIAISPMSPFEFLSAGEDGCVKRFDLRTKECDEVLSLRSHSRKVPLYSIATHPFDTEFCVCGMDKYVRVHDKRNVKDSMKLLFPSTMAGQKSRDIHVTSAVYNHDGSEILASYATDKIYLFENKATGSGEYAHSYTGHRNVQTIKGVNFFGPHSEYVISGSDCGNVFIWDRNTESIVQWMTADEEGVVNCLEGHPSFPILATSGLDHDVKIWLPTKADAKISIADLKKCVQKNISNSASDCISDLNSSLLEYLMQALSRRRRSSRATPQRDMPSSPEDNSDDSDNSFDDDDNDYIDYISNRRFGSQSCTTS